jgi:membrane associated rhomboid family serine protease
MDRALVLTSLGIPHQIMQVDNLCQLVVPVEFAENAKFEIWQYEEENKNRGLKGPAIQPHYQDAMPGVIAYVVIVCSVAWLAGVGAFGYDWLAAGRVDGVLIRQGEWWRSFTALTLHSGLKHIAGNLGFGALFGLLAGRVVGPGVAWLGILLAGGAANILNTILLESSHRSIGASTAVFAALGLVSGFVWRGKLMAQDRWPYRIGPIIGGIALLAYTGTGGENTDIGAHLAGFITGFVTGILLIRVSDKLRNRQVQVNCGIIAISILSISWMIALANTAT